MCEFWGYNCGHTWKKVCGLPKKPEDSAVQKPLTVPTKKQVPPTTSPSPPQAPSISPSSPHPNLTQLTSSSPSLVPYSRVFAQTQTHTATRTMHTLSNDPTKCCPGIPTTPKPTNSPCYNCIQKRTTTQMYQSGPSIETLKMKRQGAGNDQWGCSSLAISDRKANDGLMDNYQTGQGGYETHVGSRRFMVDKRTGERDQNLPFVNLKEGGGIRGVAPGGNSSWPRGVAGSFSTTGSQTRTESHGSGYWSGNGNGSSGSNVSFMNPFGRADSESGHVGNGLGAGLGNGVYGVQGGYGTNGGQKNFDDSEARGRFHSV